VHVISLSSASVLFGLSISMLVRVAFSSLLNVNFVFVVVLHPGLEELEGNGLRELRVLAKVVFLS